MAEATNTNWRPIAWMRPGDIGRDNHGKPVPRIELVTGHYEGVRYAVRDGRGGCLSVGHEWEHEPMPSSRDDAFYERCRFTTLAAAMMAAEAVS